MLLHIHSKATALEHSAPLLSLENTRQHCVTIPDETIIYHTVRLYGRDLQFFRLLAKGLAEKFQLITQQETISTNLEEKVLNYIRFHCSNQTIAYMEHTAFQLHCSRRQLQRVVKKLTDRGLLHKTGKGRYRLEDSSLA